MSSTQTGSTKERREFFRLNFKAPVRYKNYTDSETGSKPGEVFKGTTQNISQSGVLFETETVPPISSILWLNLDIRTIKICQEIEQRALVFKEGLLGRVVRIEENPVKKTYDVGVCFLTQNEKSSKEVQQVLSKITVN